MASGPSSGGTWSKGPHSEADKRNANGRKPRAVLRAARVVMLNYQIGSSTQFLCFTPEVLAHFRQHQQTRWYHREAGGQLFATADGRLLTVVEATGPRRTDRRTRTSYVPDRVAETREIAEQETRGRIFVGDWHTHPESVPTPSPLDRRSIQECFRESTHCLNGFLLVIVGSHTFPQGLFVSVSDGNRTYPLEPHCDLSSATTLLIGDGDA